MIPLAEDRVRTIGVRCTESCPIVNTPLRQLTGLFPDLNIVIVGIIRGDNSFVPTSTDQMLPGDEVYFVADTTHVPRALAAFGQEQPEGHRIIIIGGGNIGFNLAREIEKKSDVIARIIELDRERARKVAERMPDTTVTHGDALAAEILDDRKSVV